MQKTSSKRKDIPETTAIILWSKAGGRCEFCNKYLLEDSLTKTQLKRGYVAHIVPNSNDWVRGDPTFPEDKKNHISNLMILCGECHDRIDDEKTGERDWPTPKLMKMKEDHENTIKNLTSYKEKRRSHVILYGSNIGNHHGYISIEAAVHAMFANGYYPAEVIPIELSHKTETRDRDKEFWQTERKNLRDNYFFRVKPWIDKGEVDHFSVFAFADQPLLMELGTLLSNKIETLVYQRHHDTNKWEWLKQTEENLYVVDEPNEVYSKVALSISISGSIVDSRITDALQVERCSIWRMRIAKPNYCFIREHKQLKEFYKQFTILLDRIKAKHGEKTLLHLFPAVPMTIAVEIGRAWNEKADMRFTVYDENKNVGGYVKALDFPYKENQEDKNA